MRLNQPKVVSDWQLLDLRRWMMAIWRWPGTKLLLTAAMLTAICTAADWSLVGQALFNLDLKWLAAALAMFVAQSLVSALRWQRLVQGIAPITLAEAARHILRASAYNLIAPAKLGDLSKASMLPLPLLSPAAIKLAGLRVVAEKMADVATLGIMILVGCVQFTDNTLALCGLLACGLGWLASRLAIHRVKFFVPLAGYSLLLWGLHLVQIDFFLKAAGVFVSPHMVLSRIPLAIFAGLLPLSFCGIGTRDTALVWLFADAAPASVMAVVGMLTALRYIIPGLVGVTIMVFSRPQPEPDVLRLSEKGDYVLMELSPLLKADFDTPSISHTLEQRRRKKAKKRSRSFD